MRIKVLENTSEQLVVRMVPTAKFFVIACGVLFLLGGPLVFWILGYTTELKISANELQIMRALLGRYAVNERRIPLEDIRAIDTQVYASMGKTLDLTIHTDSAKIRVPFENLDGDAKIALASRLKSAVALGNDYSESAGSGLALTMLFVGLGMILIGLYMLSILQTSTIVGSRKEGLLKVRISRWLIPFSRESSIELSKFESVEYTERSLDGASSNSVLVQTTTGETLPLAAGAMFTDDSTRKIDAIISRWVHAANRPARKSKRKRKR